MVRLDPEPFRFMFVVEIGQRASVRAENLAAAAQCLSERDRR
jgi:hypothetical protein